MINIKIKPLSKGFVIPYKANPSDACYDVVATSYRKVLEDSEGSYIEYGLGFSTEIPAGYCALLFPRSSISKMDLIFANSVGVVDSGYAGEWKVRMKQQLCYTSYRKAYQLGDRVAQFMIVPVLDINLQILSEGEELNQLDRGGGFGSSGS